MTELSTTLCTSPVPEGGLLEANPLGIVVTPILELDIAKERLAFTRKELSALLGVSIRTICDWEKRQLLRPSLATRKRIYSRSEVERFLKETSH